jgi:hypothetical protein
MVLEIFCLDLVPQSEMGTQAIRPGLGLSGRAGTNGHLVCPPSLAAVSGVPHISAPLA